MLKIDQVQMKWLQTITGPQSAEKSVEVDAFVVQR